MICIRLSRPSWGTVYDATTKALVLVATGLLLVSSICIAGCGDANASDAGGFCDPDGGADMAICQQLGSIYAPWCCTDHGGVAIECGQPKDCVIKPGNEANMGTGANYCCPR